MKKQNFLIVGLSGKMGGLTAQRMLALGEHELSPFGIVADKENGGVVTIPCGNGMIRNYPVFSFKGLGNRELQFIKKEKPIIIDFTLKDVVKQNWETYYKKWKLPVIFGTIGINKEDIKGNKAPVIIGSPNLCAPIVSLFKFFDGLEENAMEGVSYYNSESHQSSKLEPSGTEIYFAELFRKAGATEHRLVEKIRFKTRQRTLGVPEEFLDGHGYHWCHFIPTFDTTPSFRAFSALKMRIMEHMNSFETTYPNLTDYSIEKLHLSLFNSDGTLIVGYDGDNEHFQIFTKVHGRGPYINGLFDSVLPAMVGMTQSWGWKRDIVQNMFDL